jgi:hypothetical protein
MSERIVYRRDTGGWIIQVWVSFGLAVAACAVGVLQLPSEQLDRAFLAIGFLFCLFAAFAVAKTQRDNRDGQVDTGGWIAIVWVGFAAAVALTAWGLWRMQIENWQKSYMVVAWLFLVSSTFTIAKTIRDKHEADVVEGGGARPAEPETRPAR